MLTNVTHGIASWIIWYQNHRLQAQFSFIHLERLSATHATKRTAFEFVFGDSWPLPEPWSGLPTHAGWLPCLIPFCPSCLMLVMTFRAMSKSREIKLELRCITRPCTKVPVYQNSLSMHCGLLEWQPVSVGWWSDEEVVKETASTSPSTQPLAYSQERARCVWSPRA